MARKSKAKSEGLKDLRQRVTECRLVTVKDLAPNPENPRSHPKEQREALRTALGAIGFAGVEVAYYSARAASVPTAGRFSPCADGSETTG